VITVAISMLKVQRLMNAQGIKKFDLRKMGFNPNIIDKVLSGSLNKSKRVDTETINRLCEVLHCQPGDIMEYIPGESDKISE
jgi:DNA-binding Xre family transcriptional regulator